MIMATTFKVFDKSVRYLVWKRKRIFPISSINKIVNDRNIGVKINTRIWVCILFVNAVATQFGYSAGEFQALQLIVLVAFGVVD